MKKYLLLFSLLNVLFFSCSKDDSDLTTSDLLGTWVIDCIDDRQLPTNSNIIYDFLSDGTVKECFCEESEEQGSQWIEGLLKYNLSGDLLTINIEQDKRIIHIKILDFNNDTMVWRMVNDEDGKGETFYPQVYRVRKIKNNYKSAIIGMWEGHCVTPGEDQSPHRWQYKEDGSYVYFSKNDLGEWIAKEDNKGKFIVYGDLMTTTWNNLNSGGVETENCELWNITIEKKEMSWQAVRENNKVVKFEMTQISK